jgi:hypothetical protein
MFLSAVLEPCLEILSVLFVVTQIIIPAFRDRPLFPVFRRNSRKLRNMSDELREIRVIKDVKEMESEVRRKREELNKKEEEGCVVSMMTKKEVP